jgi:hypothetical protein
MLRPTMLLYYYTICKSYPKQLFNTHSFLLMQSKIIKCILVKSSAPGLLIMIQSKFNSSYKQTLLHSFNFKCINSSTRSMAITS